MGCRESLYAVVESALGTPKASPVVGTDAWYFNLPEDDSFSGVTSPEIIEIPFGGGCAIPFDAFAGRYTTQLNWKGFVYPTLDNFLLNLALQRINAGQTVPWTTTEGPGNLASASLYKLWETEDGTIKRKRFAGCKLVSLEMSASATSPALRFSATLQAVKEVGNPVDASSDPDATEFPASTAANLPTRPYVFQDSASEFSVGGSDVTKYESLTVRVTNTIDVLHGEARFPQTMRFTGRMVEVTFQKLLMNSPDFRTPFQSVTDKATLVKFNNGSNSFQINLGAKCHLTAYTQQLGLSRAFLETVTIKGRLDGSTGNDVVLTFT